MSEDTPKGRTLIYSNRPPIHGISGGAMQVIRAAEPTWWIGPNSVADEKWNEMTPQEREFREHHEGTSFDVQTFPTPKTLEEDQYVTISNEILWPLMHSMAPNTDKSVDEIENAYFDGYLSHNELANVAIRNLRDEEGLTGDDKIWVHDYQCANVPGMIFSSHIPWPSVDFLEETTLKDSGGKDVPILATNFFRDVVENMADHALLSFQRPVDQANFIMTVAKMCGEKLCSIESDHPALQNIGGDINDPDKRVAIKEALLEEIELGTSAKMVAFGAPCSTINSPVGQNPAEIEEKAKLNEKKLDATSFSRNEDGSFKIFNAKLGDGQTANLTASNPADFDENGPTVADIVEPIRGRDWVFSVHRNDYTKGTMTKMNAAEEVLKDNPNATFLFVLQPTRENVAGYAEYAQDVFKKAQSLREEYGDKSVVVIPEGIAYDDVVGIMRQPEMRGFLSLGQKDGHDLTVREVVDANDRGTALGAVISSGIGAADVLCDGDKGGYYINNPDDHHEVATALNEILDPANSESLKQRFDVMKTRSAQFDAKQFVKTIEDAYEPAMEHRFGQDWKQGHVHPDGEYIDRKGEHHAAEDTRPPYLQDILDNKAGKHVEPQGRSR